VTIDFTGSAYNFATTPVADLAKVAQAWITKHNLPQESETMLSIPDDESGNYTLKGTYVRRSFHYQSGSGTALYQWLVSAGRQWNGIDSKAFIFMNATGVVTSASLTPADMEAVQLNITAATVARMKSTELVLLQQEMGGTHSSGAELLLEMVV